MKIVYNNRSGCVRICEDKTTKPVVGSSLNSIGFNNETLQSAVEEWTTNPETAIEKYGQFNTWDVSGVTSMKDLFANKYTFNENISDWDVSNVTDMNSMFSFAHMFNQSLNKWADKVRNVKNMNSMFREDYVFNQDISTWNVSSVTDMSMMFYDAHGFNQNISTWNVSSVTDMSIMFGDAHLFNQPLNWGTKVTNVTNMNQMFALAYVFNQDISTWDVRNVTNYSKFATNSHLCKQTGLLPKLFQDFDKEQEICV